MDDDIKKSWEKFLNPEEVRKNIIEASVFSMAYELLKHRTVDRIRDFYTIGFDQNHNLVSPTYKSKVLSLDKNTLAASLKWLRNSGAISDEDVEELDKVRQCRNTLIHEMPAYVSSSLEVDIETNFKHLIDIISKIEKWWIINVDLDGTMEAGTEDAIIPGRLLFIQMLAEVALGKDDTAQELYEQFRSGALTN